MHKAPPLACFCTSPPRARNRRLRRGCFWRSAKSTRLYQKAAALHSYIPTLSTQPTTAILLPGLTFVVQQRISHHRRLVRFDALICRTASPTIPRGEKFAFQRTHRPRKRPAARLPQCRRNGTIHGFVRTKRRVVFAT